MILVRSPSKKRCASASLQNSLFEAAAEDADAETDDEAAVATMELEAGLQRLRRLARPTCSGAFLRMNLPTGNCLERTSSVNPNRFLFACFLLAVLPLV